MDVVECGVQVGWVSIETADVDVPLDHVPAFTTTNACETDDSVLVRLVQDEDVVFEEHIFDSTGDLSLHELDVALDAELPYQLLFTTTGTQRIQVDFTSGSDDLGGLGAGPEIISVLDEAVWSRRDQDVYTSLKILPEPRGYGLALVELRDADGQVWDLDIQRADSEMFIGGSQPFDAPPVDLDLTVFQRGQDGVWVEGDTHRFAGEMPTGCSSAPMAASLLPALLLAGLIRRRRS